jgi:hypothetical protein
MELPYLMEIFESSMPSTWLKSSLLVASLGFVGCSAAGPEEHGLSSVHGTVLRKSGQPFADGAIDFRATDQSGAAASGAIGPDGAFTLSSVIGDAVVPGAKPGQYRVTVIPAMGQDQSTTPPITLKKLYTVEPKENHLTVTLE